MNETLTIPFHAVRVRGAFPSDLDAGALVPVPATKAGHGSQFNGDKEDMNQNLAFQHLSADQWVAVDQAIAALQDARSELT